MAEPSTAEMRHGRWTTSYRSIVAILIFGLLILILLWTAVLWRVSIEYKAILRDAAASASTVASALEQQTLRAIRQVDQTTRFVKYEYEHRRGEFDLHRTLSEGIVADRFMVLVSLADANGDVFATTLPDAARVNIADREHFRVHLQSASDGLFISHPVFGRVSRKWVLQFTRRLNRPDGSFAGVVVVSQEPSYFTSDFYTNAVLGQFG